MSPLLIIMLVWTGIAALVIVTGMSLALYHTYRKPPRYLTLTVTTDDPADDPADETGQEVEREAA